MAPFIQTFVGLWIIFLQDQREEELNQEEDGKELQVQQQHELWQDTIMLGYFAVADFEGFWFH